MVIGDRRKFLSMVLTLKTEVNLENMVPTSVLAADSLFVGNQIGSSAKTLEEAGKDPLWTKYFNDGMKAANAKTTSNAQIVQKWILLPSDFSEAGGELTPTMKLKRSVAAAKYTDVIEAMYAE
jgi:long-chain-fatty-acid--CoA ligase ACSBG